MGYAELHAYSNFTFLEGASHPEELVDVAVECGLEAIALTDRDGLYGSVRFAARARERGIAAIVGSELTFEDQTRIVLLVEDEIGYANLCELISTAQMRGGKSDARLRWEDFPGHCAGLIALCGGEHGPIERALLCAEQRAAQSHALRLQEFFEGRFFLELQHHLLIEDATRCERLIRLAEQLRIPYVATNGIVYARKSDAMLADVLRCIRLGRSLAQARSEYRLRANAEWYLKTPRAMQRMFRVYPQAIENTLLIARRCGFRLHRLEGQFPLFPVPPGETVQSYLRTLVMQGAKQRYGTPLTAPVERQLDYELGIIAKLEMAGYFLIVWDIVRLANEIGVLCQGRGSAANSAVCYALGITAVDPVGMGLLFERFLSEERNEVPDIDIDFAHQDRERVIQYVYERYGRAHAAMAAEVITYKTRSAMRDVGKALGFCVEQIEGIAREEGAAVEASLLERFLALARRIDGFPRHMGIHSGGIVLTRDPLVRVAPIEWARMRDRSVLQWDKDDLQILGLIKIDVLGLGMLSLLREAFSIQARCLNRLAGRENTLIPQSRNEEATETTSGDWCVGFFRNSLQSGAQESSAQLSLASIPPDDAPTYAMLSRADTIGVFQVESRAQQSMLPRMQPRCFYDIVMQVAIIRPGPIQGKMIHPFLRRREGSEAVTYPHPKLQPILERTLGVPLFQEQGMRLAIEAAGFSAGEADRLRRAMGHKRSHERMLEIRPGLIDGMVRNGIDRTAAESIYQMLEGFADYGFPESHAASFALLTYASAFIKCHFPAIFTAAILNVQPMGFYSTEVLVNDARRHGVIIEPIQVNASELLSHIDAQGALRLGYHLVRDLGSDGRRRLQIALASGAEFTDLDDFLARTNLDAGALESLASAGAFSPWYPSRREAIWALRGALERRARGELAQHMSTQETTPSFRTLSPKAQTALDLWSTGVSPNAQAMQYLRARLDAERVLSAVRLVAMPNNLVCRVGGLVITRQRPQTAKGFVFLTLEDETGLVNVIVRPDVYERYRRTIRDHATLVIEGKLQKQRSCIDVLARQVWAFDTEGLVDGVRARNFH